MKLELEVLHLNSFLGEIFGTEERPKEGLLLKPLTQRVKYNLKKLGNAIMAEQKIIAEQVKSVQEKFFTEETTYTDSEGKTTPTKRVPEDKIPEYTNEIQQINALKITVECYDFTEDDFEDQKTGKMVSADGIYYNIIDKLLGWND